MIPRPPSTTRTGAPFPYTPLFRSRLEDRGDEVPHHILSRLGEVEELVGELGRPDHVGGVEIDIGIAGGEPQPVLPELVGGRGWHRYDGHRDRKSTRLNSSH